MPLLFAVDMKYDLPRSRAASRAEEVKKKKIAKAQRRASSRVVSRGGIIEPTPAVGQSELSGAVGIELTCWLVRWLRSMVSTSYLA